MKSIWRCFSFFDFYHAVPIHKLETHYLSWTNSLAVTITTAVPEAIYRGGDHWESLHNRQSLRIVVSCTGLQHKRTKWYTITENYRQCQPDGPCWYCHNQSKLYVHWYTWGLRSPIRDQLHSWLLVGLCFPRVTNSVSCGIIVCRCPGTLRQRRKYSRDSIPSHGLGLLDRSICAKTIQQYS